MLCANETIAEEFYWREIPFLYRIHEIPDHEKIDKLQVFLQNFGIYLKSSHDEIHPKEVQKLLTKIEGTPEEPFDIKIYETGKIFCIQLYAFWIVHKILLPFYITDPKISRSSDPQDHQGNFA
jgi:hypothetical protein